LATTIPCHKLCSSAANSMVYFRLMTFCLNPGFPKFMILRRTPNKVCRRGPRSSSGSSLRAGIPRNSCRYHNRSQRRCRADRQSDRDQYRNRRDLFHREWRRRRLRDSVPGSRALLVARRKAGFKTTDHGPIELSVNDRTRIDVGLDIGQSTDKVMVTAAAPLLKTDWQPRPGCG
jgi:hypothetical protein